jgi:hypothetical protein
MTRRLHVLSTVQYPKLHPVVIQLQLKLIDVYIHVNVSKQRTIKDFFKPVEDESSGYI